MTSHKEYRQRLPPGLEPVVGLFSIKGGQSHGCLSPLQAVANYRSSLRVMFTMLLFYISLPLKCNAHTDLPVSDSSLPLTMCPIPDLQNISQTIVTVPVNNKQATATQMYRYHNQLAKVMW